MTLRKSLYLLIGESPDRIVIRLADHAPGFEDSRAPRAVVMITSKMIDGPTGRDYDGKGQGNDAYENFLGNLTIDVGEENSGAIGFDYLANNLGAVRNVVVWAPQGSEATEIAMIRKWPGPTLLQRVSVEGFDVGINVTQTEYSMTLSQLRLKGQRVAGLHNADNMVTVENLGIEGTAGPGLLNRTSKEHGDAGRRHDRRGLLRRSGDRQRGHARPRRDAGARGGVDCLPRGRPMAGWRAGPGIPRYPACHYPAHSPRCRSQTHQDHGWGVSGVADDAAPVDSIQALRAAFRQGPMVYLQHGTFWISAPIEIPPCLRRLVGLNSTIRTLPLAWGGFPHQQGMLRVLQDGANLSIEHLAFDNTDGGNQVGIEHSAARSVVLRDVMSAEVLMLDRKPSGGPAFLEDVCCGTLHVAGPASVVAQQLNTEGGGVRLQNQGAPLVILGVKTEGNCTVVSSTVGGRTVLLGGLLYMVAVPKPEALPAFTSAMPSWSHSSSRNPLRATSYYTAYLARPGHTLSRPTPCRSGASAA